MAGSNPDFNSSEFRSGIRTAMTMGSPVDDVPVFHFPDTSTSDTPAAADGVPFDPSTVEDITTGETVSVTCGIEYSDYAQVTTNIGVLTPSAVRISVLDTEYEQIKGCHKVVIGDNEYIYSHTMLPSVMFDVQIFDVIFRAVDQA